MAMIIIHLRENKTNYVVIGGESDCNTRSSGGNAQDDREAARCGVQ